MIAKQVIKYILKELCSDESANQLQKSLSNSIKKEDEKYLAYLKEALNISSDEYSELCYRIENTQAMPHTQLLNFIIHQLEEEGFKWNGQKELFHILIPNEDWSDYKKSWYQWKNEHTQQIKKDTIRQAIQESLDFDSYLWNASEVEQRKVIPKKITAFILNNKNKNKDKNKSEIKTPSIDLSSIQPREAKLSTEESDFLKELEIETTFTIEEKLLEHKSLFSSEHGNQTFFLKVIPILYNKGFYLFLKEEVFPILSRHHRDKADIKMQEAYTLINCSCASYEEIFYLLQSIPQTTTQRKLEIDTMTIFAFTKDQIYNHINNKEELFKILKISIQYYQLLYIQNKNYSLSIHLAYAIKTINIFFPNSKEAQEFNIDDIYNKTKPLIVLDKKLGGDISYEASMKQFEFLLLLNQFHTLQEVELFLEDAQPKVSLIKQKINEIKCFIHVIKKFDDQNEELKHFVKILELFNSYLYWQ
ncbi:MAG: Unknown protein [uncultured Sulfurovum sp.]|uniref:Uncharacterized protein n=1 Tax=uncultured Sulfurovum sp. TaxID=269237 RepID=A0A6S6TD43_9BACT|nr:MAG: Unknown protein [uncultured Sulfurovum sp.]